MVLFYLLVLRKGHDEDLDQGLTFSDTELIQEEEELMAQFKKPHPQLFKKKKESCESYLDYSVKKHGPLSEGVLKLPNMRPPVKCRTFTSAVVDETIAELKRRVKDADLGRLIENCLPNTLDTTILWYKKSQTNSNGLLVNYNDLAKTFVVTGDIHAEWLRDSARQLSVYQPFIQKDELLKDMIKGAINLQSWFITRAPYCNAFQPPEESRIKREKSAIDYVTPKPSWKTVFECKWELDSLASFLTLTNEYYENSNNDLSIFNELWLDAFEIILKILRRQSSPTFDKDGNVLPFYYTFQRDTKIGSETLPLAGTGNPVNSDTGLIRSSFRPSDDACIYQYFIPANIHMLVELRKILPVLKKLKQDATVEVVETYIEKISTGIKNHGIVDHAKFGKVYAYEVDGFGSVNMMDDANVPSLLSIPDLGFTGIDDSVYQNTRKLVLSQNNPYYREGKHFKGVGGPHIGIHSAWPMSLLVLIRTSDDDDEIMENLELLKKTTGGLGLMHESINVNYPRGLVYTRPWFAWCNSEFGKTILDLARRKPHLIFKKEYLNDAFII